MREFSGVPAYNPHLEWLFFVDKSKVIHMAGVWVSFKVAAWVRLVVDKVAAWVRLLLAKWPHGCGS